MSGAIWSETGGAIWSEMSGAIWSEIVINEPGSQTGNRITVTISALTGAEIKRITMIGASTTLDITSLPAGIYLVKATTGERVLTGKLVRE